MLNPEEEFDPSLTNLTYTAFVTVSTTSGGLLPQTVARMGP